MIDNEIDNDNKEEESFLWFVDDKSQIDSRLSHLNKKQISELLKRYYNGEKNETLVEDYELNISSPQLVRIFPSIIYHHKLCPYCNSPMESKRPSKSCSRYNLDIKCPRCKHIDNNEYCQCNGCIFLREEKRKVEIIEKRNLIKLSYSIENLKSIIFEELSPYEKLCLATIVRGGLDENMEKIIPIENFERSLAPLAEYSFRMIKLMTDKNILYPHPNSAIEAFKNDENFPNTYYIYKVFYHINVVSNKLSREELLDKILNIKREDLGADTDVLYNIWIEIALEECKVYLVYSMGKVNFNFNIGEKTISVFKDLLEHFSVAQIYGIIYKSISNATRFYQESKTTKKHAANSVISNCQRFGERAVANSWDIVKYNKVSELPQSLISETFFNRILNIAEKGFNEKPSIQLIDGNE